MATNGKEIPADEVAHLLSLLHKHVNTLVRCEFALPERIVAGDLRTLYNPGSREEQLIEIP